VLGVPCQGHLHILYFLSNMIAIPNVSVNRFARKASNNLFMSSRMRCISIPKVRVSLRSAQDSLRGDLNSISPQQEKEWTPPPKVAQKVLEEISQVSMCYL
jgi:hypothetical protein